MDSLQPRGGRGLFRGAIVCWYHRTGGPYIRYNASLCPIVTTQAGVTLRQPGRPPPQTRRSILISPHNLEGPSMIFHPTRFHLHFIEPELLLPLNSPRLVCCLDFVRRSNLARSVSTSTEARSSPFPWVPTHTYISFYQFDNT